MLSLSENEENMKEKQYICSSFDISIPSDVVLKEQDLSLFFMDQDIKPDSYKKITEPKGEFFLEFRGDNQNYLFSGEFTQDTLFTNEQQVSKVLHFTIEKNKRSLDDPEAWEQENSALADNLRAFIETIKCEILPSGKILTVTNKGTAVLRKRDTDRKSSPMIMMIRCDRNNQGTKEFIVRCGKALVTLNGIQCEDGTVKVLTGEYNKKGISIDLSSAPTIEKQADLVLQKLKSMKEKPKEEPRYSSWWE